MRNFEINFQALLGSKNVLSTFPEIKKNKKKFLMSINSSKKLKIF